MSADAVSLQLFITGDSPNSVKAVARLREFCDEHRHRMPPYEVIDLLKLPHRALEEGVLITPTLRVKTDTGIREIIGNLSDSSVLLDVIGKEEHHDSGGA